LRQRIGRPQQAQIFSGSGARLEEREWLGMEIVAAKFKATVSAIVRVGAVTGCLRSSDLA
jgi:hypothetical protein